MFTSFANRLTALAVAFFLVAASASAGYLARPLILREGPRLTGTLLTIAFHPRIAAGCDTDEARGPAVAAALLEQQAKRLLVRLLSPSRAIASATGDCTVTGTRFGRNLIVDTGENFLVDAFQNLTEPENLKFHGIGTGVLAAAETNTGCGTELTTQYNPDNTRATGSLTEGAASNVFRTVGTNTVDAAVAVTEWCLMSQAATGGGTMWSRVVFAALNLASGDSLQTTYDLTVE